MSEDHFIDIIKNKKARFNYDILETFEAGIVLKGTEVKSIRAGHASLVGSFARVENHQAILHQLNILPYDHGNRFNHDPERPRKLLLHKTEINHLLVQTEQKGHTVVPLSIYIRRGLVKIELGLCRGKVQADKRETLRRRDADREAQRAIAHHSRR